MGTAHALSCFLCSVQSYFHMPPSWRSWVMRQEEQCLEIFLSAWVLEQTPQYEIACLAMNAVTSAHGTYHLVLIKTDNDLWSYCMSL